MNTVEAPRTIKATIVQNAISRVPSFFDAGLDDIMNELLQNARRAGATRVDITAENGVISVADDGAGIADPQTILSFGDSQWSDDNANFTRVMAEHPAGMGFYALARRARVTVYSSCPGIEPWTVTLEPEHFSGQQPAQVFSAPEGNLPHGTRVTFNWEHAFEHEIMKAVKHYPLPVNLNGMPLEREEFLQQAMTITEWEGLRIGVIEQQPHHSRPYYHYDNRQINFHGIVIHTPEHLPQVPLLGSRRSLIARIDVNDCPHLELTLPARKELVQTYFLQRMKETALRTIYTTIAESDVPLDVSRATQQDAASWGITIPDAQPKLPLWQPYTEWQDSDCFNRRQTPEDLPYDALLMAAELENQMEHNVYQALDHADLTRRVFDQNDGSLQGYPWYDRLERITDAQVVATFGNREVTVDPDPKGRSNRPKQRPDAISVRLTLQHPDGNRRIMTFAADAAMVDEEYTFIGDVQPLVKKDATITPHELASLTMAAYFSVLEDHESDSYYTQEKWNWEMAMGNAIAMLQSPDDALAHALKDAAKGAGAMTLSPSSVVTMRIMPHGDIEVHIARPETE